MTPIKLIGAQGSPYSRKMRAIMRYRRLAYVWITRGSAEDKNTPEVPVNLIPVLVFPDGRAMIDSTPIIRVLEEQQKERSIIPADPALAFLDALIEDFADEWLTKAMFHYRWTYQPDIAKAAALLPLSRDPSQPEDEHKQLSAYIAERQIGRLAIVGSNPATGAVIEEFYRHCLGAMDAALRARAFVMGERPGAGDFALYGQFSQLALFDPTPAALALEVSPRLVAWCENMEDLSGLDAELNGGRNWLKREEAADALEGFLQLCGAYYVPFLLANAEALAAGEKQVSCEVAGHSWQQGAFAYQGKCLQWLREGYNALSADDRAFIDAALTDTGCELLFEE